MLTVCTGWSPRGWTEYGERFAETFDKFWDPDVRLIVYGEEPRPLPGKSGRQWEFRPLPPGCQAFLDRHPEPVYHGRERFPDHPWKERAIANAYNWRFDVCKFSRQGFIPLDALRSCQPGDHLVWLDGDVVTHRQVDARNITGLLRPDKSIAYFGRWPKHPEIGFQLYRVEPPAIAFLMMFEQLYVRDTVLLLKEWHSAYAWAEAMRMVDPDHRHAQDLTPGGSGHVWHQSPLRQWTDHLKGDRKKSGRSPERRP